MSVSLMGRSEDQVEEVVSWCREQQQGVKLHSSFPEEELKAQRGHRTCPWGAA